LPHVNIKHFPKEFSVDEMIHLIDVLTAVVTKHFGVSDDAVSIALEPVVKDDWKDSVITPEITERRHLLIKTPNY
jgi:4-oxalocrotonate tautomerase